MTTVRQRRGRKPTGPANAPRAGNLGRITRCWLAGMSAGASLCLASGPAGAAPSGEDVVHGTAQVTRAGSHTQIDTTTQRTIIRWDSFDIRASESVHAQQPSTDSRLLNRVNNARLTQVDGSLTSNGEVWIVNPAGVYFGGTAVVKVEKLVAAAADVADHSFLRGRDLHFANVRGEVRNAGEITANDVALVGRRVANEGRIVAQGTPEELKDLVNDQVWLNWRFSVLNQSTWTGCGTWITLTPWP